MQIKHGVIEMVVIVTLVAAATQWINQRPQQPPVAKSTPAGPPGVKDYLVNNVHLGMTQEEFKKSLIRSSQEPEVETHFDAGGRLSWIKGTNFTHLSPIGDRATNTQGGYISDLMLRRGSERRLVLQSLGSPNGYNDNDSKWGYWTKGLPDPEMGILLEFNGEQVESVEMATKWSELASHLASPILTKPSPVMDAPNPESKLNSIRNNSPYNPPPQPRPGDSRPVPPMEH